jgi:hypothetical protein
MGGAASAAPWGDEGTEMTYTYKTVDKAAPFWAAFVAPLVGAPIMVVLFALAPTQGADVAVEPEDGFAIEQVEVLETGAVVATGLEVDS